MRPYLDRQTVCVPCGANPSEEQCEALCSDKGKLHRVFRDPHLLMRKDVVVPCIGVIIWVSVAVLIGIPALFMTMIYLNEPFLRHVAVYGSNVAMKWATLIARLKAAAVYLYLPFKYIRFEWGLWLIIQKFITMVAWAFATHGLMPFSFGLPLIYVVAFGLTIHFRPYYLTGANVLEAALLVVNFLCTLPPMIGVAGGDVPILATLVVTVVMVVLGIVFRSVFRCLTKPFFQPDDPTLVKKYRPQEKEARNQVIASRRNERTEISKMIGIALREWNEIHEHLDQLGYHPEAKEAVSERLQVLDDVITQLNERSVMKQDDPEFIFDADWINLHIDLVASVAEIEEGRPDKPEGELFDGEYVWVNQRKLAKTMDRMYDMIDRVSDGLTLELVLNAMNIATIVGGIAFGWYVAALLIYDGPETYGDFDCS
jgi:hypothetical protein